MDRRREWESKRRRERKLHICNVLVRKRSRIKINKLTGLHPGFLMAKYSHGPYCTDLCIYRTMFASYICSRHTIRVPCTINWLTISVLLKMLSLLLIVKIFIYITAIDFLCANRPFNVDAYQWPLRVVWVLEQQTNI